MQHHDNKGEITFGNTEEFKIQAGLHEGSALRPFLFILPLDTFNGHVRTKIP